jgi:FkbM family methyltransferase
MAAFGPPNCLIHVGAGECEALTVYRQWEKCRTILIEPQPILASSLESKTIGAQNIEVLQAAVSIEKGQRQFHVFNFRELSSLEKPDRLHELFPGLEIQKQFAVKVFTLTDLVRKFSINSSSENWLVIDAPGSEESILESLPIGHEAAVFSSVFFRSSCRHFNSSSNEALIISTLNEKGYDQIGRSDFSHPSTPRFHMRFNPIRLKNAGLTSKLEGRDRELSKMKETFEKSISELEDRNNQITSFKKQLADQASQFEEQEKTRLATEKSLAEQVEQLQTMISETKSDLSTSLRLLALREADLRELQNRYGDLLERKKEYENLLVKLRKRLELAADYLLQNQPTEEDVENSKIAAKLVHALSGELVVDD